MLMVPPCDIGKIKAYSPIDNHELEFQCIEELLGIEIDSALTFENHINKICKKN